MRKALLEQPGFGRSEQVGLSRAAALNPKLSPRETGENHKENFFIQEKKAEICFMPSSTTREEIALASFFCLLSAIDDNKIF